MPSVRVLRGVVGNVLGSYLSRYSTFDGYWLFGFLVPDLDNLQVDLLGPIAIGETPREQAVARAQQLFHEQLAKARYPRADITRATLVLSKDEPMRVEHEGRSDDGWRLVARIAVTTAGGRTFEAHRSIGVCKHDPQQEHRSAA
jgi:hypothetical protein